MEKALYLVTGAAGHLGNTVVGSLLALNQQVRALILPSERPRPSMQGAEIVEGDVCLRDSLAPFFKPVPGLPTKLIHCAGVISIGSRFQKRLFDVNVEGTRNILACCKDFAVSKLVHVSSVHAIPEQPAGQIISEIDHFDPDQVVGYYAKSKAQASQLVLDAAKEGLDASIVHPSGICGPNDYGRGHISQLFKDYCNGALAAIVKGGYDFCDVRDVAQGILACAEKGRPGQCYILSGDYYTIPQMVEYFHIASGGKAIKAILPMWMAKMTAPLSELYYKLRKQPPLYTPYSLYTLTSNANFSHAKAQRELGYSVRPMLDTVRDMAVWLKEKGFV